MFGLPVWVWVVAAVVGVVLLLAFARRAFRAGVRRELVAFLAEHYPQIAVVGERSDRLFLRTPSGADGEWNLAKVYAAVADLPNSATAADRAGVFRHFADALIPSVLEADAPLSLATAGDRILPRLVRPEFLAGMPPDADTPSVPLPDLGLAVVYVLDSPASVRYLTGQDLPDLGLDVRGLHDHALGNLRKRFAKEPVASAVGGAVVLVKELDSFDAARLLVVPDFLDPGQEVAAVVPDRDTLGLAPVPADGDWAPIREMAKIPGGEHLLLARPLRVTAAGFELV